MPPLPHTRHKLPTLPAELQSVARELKTPAAIQAYLDATPYSDEECYRSPLSVVRPQGALLRRGRVRSGHAAPAGPPAAAGGLAAQRPRRRPHAGAVPGGWSAGRVGQVELQRPALSRAYLPQPARDRPVLL